jgi:hypothetical protein
MKSCGLRAPAYGFRGHDVPCSLQAVHHTLQAARSPERSTPSTSWLPSAEWPRVPLGPSQRARAIQTQAVPACPASVFLCRACPMAERSPQARVSRRSVPPKQRLRLAAAPQSEDPPLSPLSASHACSPSLPTLVRAAPAIGPTAQSPAEGSSGVPRQNRPVLVVGAETTPFRAPWGAVEGQRISLGRARRLSRLIQPRA